MPQGSGLGPIQFIAYTENTTTDIFQKHGIQYHLFADDTQVYSFSQVRDAPALLSRLSDCIGELATSYASHRLQLNATKSEFIWFGSRSVLSKIPQQLHQVTIGSTTVHCCDVVRDLGVYLDSELTMKKTVSSGYYHLRKLYHLHRPVCHEAASNVVCSAAH